LNSSDGLGFWILDFGLIEVFRADSLFKTALQHLAPVNAIANPKSKI